MVDAVRVAALKLPFFPAPDEGETIYSVCARFHRLSGYARSEYSSRLMLGHSRGGWRPDLVTGLRHLEVASGHLVDRSELTIRTRTVLGAYLPFMTAVRRQHVIEAIGTSDGDMARSAAGLPWSAALLRHELRGCPVCIAEGQRRHGYACWKSDHQLPGVWICSEHRRPLLALARRGVRNANWVTADDANLIELLPARSPAVLQQLESIAAAASWLRSQNVLNVDALSSMVRLRFRRESLIRSELKCSRRELEQIHATRALPLVETGLSQFQNFKDGAWLRHTLFDRRYAHPLRWALALAFSGPTDPSPLSRDYFEALEREPQPLLIPDLAGSLRAAAPKELYDALVGPVSIRDAAKISGLRPGEIARWLRKDPDLAQAWKTSAHQVKHRAAAMMIRGTLLANPCATRQTLLRNASWAFRWLEQNDRELLNSLAPPPYGRRVQGDLWSV